MMTGFNFLIIQQTMMTTQNQRKNKTKIQYNKYSGVKYNPYKLTMTNDKSETKDEVKLLSIEDIKEIIREYKSKYEAKICNTCGQHFETYTARDIHNSFRMYHTDKSCKIQFNINKYDKTQVDQSFHDQLTIYIHFTEKRLNEISGLNSLICQKLKDEIEILPSNIFSTDTDNENEDKMKNIFVLLYQYSHWNKSINVFISP